MPHSGTNSKRRTVSRSYAAPGRPHAEQRGRLLLRALTSISSLGSCSLPLQLTFVYIHKRLEFMHVIEDSLELHPALLSLADGYFATPSSQRLGGMPCFYGYFRAYACKIWLNLPTDFAEEPNFSNLISIS